MLGSTPIVPWTESREVQALYDQRRGIERRIYDIEETLREQQRRTGGYSAEALTVERQAAINLRKANAEYRTVVARRGLGEATDEEVAASDAKRETARKLVDVGGDSELQVLHEQLRILDHETIPSVMTPIIRAAGTEITKTQTKLLPRLVDAVRTLVEVNARMSALDTLARTFDQQNPLVRRAGVAPGQAAAPGQADLEYWLRRVTEKPAAA